MKLIWYFLLQDSSHAKIVDAERVEVADLR
jgi:hypothetical protein